MGIEGNLNTMELAELLQWLAQSRKTGTLMVDSGEVKKRIFFQDGIIIGSASSDPREYLGHFLVSHGFLSEEQLVTAIRKQDESKMLLGKILVSSGVIPEENLQEMLQLKSEETIYELFNWGQGEFFFQDDELPDYTMIPQAVAVQNLMLEGMRRVDEWRRIREDISSAQAVPVSVSDLLDDPEMPEGERRVLELVNDDRSIEEICIHTHSSEFYVSRILFEACRNGKLKVVRPRGDGGHVQATVSDEVVESEFLLRRGRELLDAGQHDPALRHLRAARSLEPDNKTATDTLKAAEQVIRHQAEKEGLAPSTVLVLKVALERLMSAGLSPQEGFMLSRINGQYDVQSLLRLTPLPPLDGLLVLSKLLSAGYVGLKE